ncbi:Nucleotide-binding universal stress protein, UspA family [Rubritalea squalenifaciens DSM 18772]|uniref:Universal stress protein n=2 Tax=Rubritaleaceae TaxID=1648490 RepID=A0A1M6P0E4_9BACT|nr:Nucleotide-binding universal stress protein, UspA family [Rubritalea squalenifaciens DSM 18772]
MLGLIVMKSIIAALDFSEGMHEVLKQAGEIALAFKARLYLVHVVETTPLYTMYGMHPEELPTLGEYRDAAKQRGAKKLAEARQELDPQVADVHGELLEGDAIDEILEFSKKVSGDLVICATHGHTALGSVLMGSVPSGLVRKAKVPVLVIPVHK